MRQLNFSDGFSSNTAPTIGSITVPNNRLEKFSSDSDFVTYKGSSATEGDIYFNTTDDKAKLYTNGNWVFLVQTDSNGNVELQSVVIAGDLTVQGTTTTIEAENLNVSDKNIIINKDGNDASSQGAGITVDRTSSAGSLVYDSTTASKWKVGNIGSEKEIVDVSSSQTLTNKTITSPSGLVKADVGLSNVDNTSDLNKPISTATQAVLDDISDDLDNHVLSTSAHGTSSAIVGVSDSQVLTNKDVDGGTASNTSRITIPQNTLSNLQGLTRKEGTVLYASDVDKIYIDTGTALQEVGSGSGSINFIGNGSAETGTTGWATYADAAGTRPVDGTGGTPNVTWTTSSSSPLSGVNSFLFTKDASNRQGQGASFDFTIENAYKAKVLQIEMDYIVNSGTFAAGSNTTDGDLIVYLYDKDNNVLIEPSNFKFLSNNSSVSDKFTSTFQTAYNSTNYRLIIHCASTSASAYTIKFDNIKVSPSKYVYGSPITGEIEFTPVVTHDSGTATNYTARIWYRRIGDRAVGRWKVSWSGASAAFGSFYMSLPFTPDVTNFVGGNGITDIGKTRMDDTGTTQVLGTTGTYNGKIFPQPGFTASHTGNAPLVTWAGSVSNTYPYTLANGDTWTGDFDVKVQGWQSSVRMSDGYEGRVLSTTRLKDASQSITSVAETTVTFNKTQRDTANMADVTNNGVRIVSSGDYSMSFTISVSNLTVGERLTLRIKRNGSELVTFNALEGQGASNAFGNANINSYELNAGDLITATVESSTDTSYNCVYALLTVAKNHSPQTIAATATISAKYYTTVSVSLPAYASTVATKANTIIHDYTGSYNPSTGYFTCPVAGEYEVGVFCETDAVSLSLSASAGARVILNGTPSDFIATTRSQSTSSITRSFTGTQTFVMKSGETLAVGLYSDVATTSSSYRVWFRKVG